MSDGKTHFKVWYRSSYAVLPASALYSAVDPFTAIGMIVGYVMGLILDPDLDQISITLVEGRVMRAFGLLGSFWVAYWMPYAYIFPHRSFLSHFPGISTVIRLIYGFWWVIVGLWYFELLNNSVLWIFFGIWLGLTIADSLHYFMDFFWSKYVR